MLTRAGWTTLVLAVAAVGAGRLLGLQELYVLATMAVALCAVSLVAVRRSPHLHVDRLVVPSRVHVGSASRIELRVRNGGRRSSPVVTLFEPVQGTVGAEVSVAPLRAGDGHGATYRLPTERRGTIRIGPLEAQRLDPFGLARRRSVVTEATRLTVLPAVEVLRGVPVLGGLDDPLAGVARHTLGARGSGDFSSLRPYVPGDDLRRVHWASTARAGDLLVRQDDPPWQGHLTVLLDLDPARLDAERFERAVSAVASTIAAAAASGDRVRLLDTSGTDTGLVDARSALDPLLERLATVQRAERPGVTPPLVEDRSANGALVAATGTPDRAFAELVDRLAERFGTVIVFAFGDADGPDVEPAGAAGGLGRASRIWEAVPDDRPFPAAWGEALARAR